MFLFCPRTPYYFKSLHQSPLCYDGFPHFLVCDDLDLLRSTSQISCRMSLNFLIRLGYCVFRRKITDFTWRAVITGHQGYVLSRPITVDINLGYLAWGSVFQIVLLESYSFSLSFHTVLFGRKSCVQPSLEEWKIGSPSLRSEDLHKVKFCVGGLSVLSTLTDSVIYWYQYGFVGIYFILQFIIQYSMSHWVLLVFKVYFERP